MIVIQFFNPLNALLLFLMVVVLVLNFCMLEFPLANIAYSSFHFFSSQKRAPVINYIIAFIYYYKVPLVVINLLNGLLLLLENCIQCNSIARGIHSRRRVFQRLTHSSSWTYSLQPIFIKRFLGLDSSFVIHI